MLNAAISLVLICSSPPLLEVTDTIDPGGTAVYTVSLGEESVYWLTLNSVGGNTDLHVAAASSEMDFEHFMTLPYREDFFYALEFAVTAGMEVGDESLTLPAEYSGPVYIVVHDAGGDGGEFALVIR